MNPNITKSTLSLVLHSFSTMTTEPSICCRLSYCVLTCFVFSSKFCSCSLLIIPHTLVRVISSWRCDIFWVDTFLHLVCMLDLRSDFFEEKKNVIAWKLVLWFIQNKCIDNCLLRLWEGILIIKRFAGCCACRRLSTLKKIVRSCTSKKMFDRQRQLLRFHILCCLQMLDSFAQKHKWEPAHLLNGNITHTLKLEWLDCWENFSEQILC